VDTAEAHYYFWLAACILCSSSSLLSIIACCLVIGQNKQLRLLGLSETALQQPLPQSSRQYQPSSSTPMPVDPMTPETVPLIARPSPFSGTPQLATRQQTASPLYHGDGTHVERVWRLGTSDRWAENGRVGDGISAKPIESPNR
jgi:hypothetical protein